MPAQQRVRRHQPAQPQGSWQQRVRTASTARSAPSSLGPGVLPPQHRDLLAQDQELGVLRRRRAASSTIHPARRTNIRYSSRTITSPRSCQRRPATMAGILAGQRTSPVLEPHMVIAGDERQEQRRGPVLSGCFLGLAVRPVGVRVSPPGPGYRSRLGSGVRLPAEDFACADPGNRVCAPDRAPLATRNDLCRSNLSLTALAEGPVVQVIYKRGGSQYVSLALG